ncbi:hypothetical protein BDY21DRAFT_366856 [Lineolata rhizophorae]|uniref:Uncharacterized protein n=1 Tax=Lineolata rhizophorae TaxID=578093 RepID=A0A6A6NPF4_9PEZI|nr:hypothetical protein BDY21DRAFT_366856 [Lineolata rhizophorae]
MHPKAPLFRLMRRQRVTSLREELGYGHQNSNGSLMNAVRKCIQNYETASGIPAADLLDWKSIEHQAGLSDMTHEFLENEDGNQNPSRLQYSRDSATIAGNLKKLFYVVIHQKSKNIKSKDSKCNNSGRSLQEGIVVNLSDTEPEIPETSCSPARSQIPTAVMVGSTSSAGAQFMTRTSCSLAHPTSHVTSPGPTNRKRSAEELRSSSTSATTPHGQPSTGKRRRNETIQGPVNASERPMHARRTPYGYSRDDEVTKDSPGAQGPAVNNDESKVSNIAQGLPTTHTATNSDWPSQSTRAKSKVNVASGAPGKVEKAHFSVFSDMNKLARANIRFRVSGVFEFSYTAASSPHRLDRKVQRYDTAR